MPLLMQKRSIEQICVFEAIKSRNIRTQTNGNTKTKKKKTKEEEEEREKKITC